MANGALTQWIAVLAVVATGFDRLRIWYTKMRKVWMNVNTKLVIDAVFQIQMKITRTSLHHCRLCLPSSTPIHHTLIARLFLIAAEIIIMKVR